MHWVERFLHTVEDHKKLVIWFVTQGVLVGAFAMEQSGATFESLALWSVTLACAFAGLKTVETVASIKKGPPDVPKAP